jgi:hypothetical protein
MRSSLLGCLKNALFVSSDLTRLFDLSGSVLP